MCMRTCVLCMHVCVHICMCVCACMCLGIHTSIYAYYSYAHSFILGVFLNLPPSNVESELNPDLAGARSCPFFWFNWSTCFVDFQVSAFQCSRMTYSLPCRHGFYMYFKYINSSPHASVDVLYQLNHLHSPRFLYLNCKHFLYVLHIMSVTIIQFTIFSTLCTDFLFAE